MSTAVNEITIFRPNSRKREATIQSLIPQQTVDVLAERLGADAGEKAKASYRTMDRLDIDLLQFKIGDRRIRIKKRD